MVDRPIGKVEGLIESFFDWCRETKEDVQEIFSAGHEPLEKYEKAHPRIFKTAYTLIAVFVCGFIIVGFATPKTVAVRIDDSRAVITTYYETTSRRVDSFLQTHDVDYNQASDLIDVDPAAGIEDNMVINIAKPFDVEVSVDGQVFTYRTMDDTVGDILAALDIKTGINDQINFDSDYVVKKGDKIIISRVLIDYVTEEIKTSYSTQYVADSSLTIGSTEVKQKGQKGLQEKTYLTVSVDGEEISRTLVESTVLQKKKDKIVHYGTKILSGVPKGLKYKEKFTRVRAVSYHFSGTPRGVYGLPCEYGTCAVDRKLIPLGSLLYIEGYGYAVANDVGSAIKGKTVDLYMERRAQCGVWGARWTNVYVLEYGDDTRFWER